MNMHMQIFKKISNFWRFYNNIQGAYKVVVLFSISTSKCNWCIHITLRSNGGGLQLAAFFLFPSLYISVLMCDAQGEPGRKGFQRVA